VKLKPGMMSHPPIPVHDLAAHIDDLKSNDNMKFSQEYESIEPGNGCLSLIYTGDQGAQRPQLRFEKDWKNICKIVSLSDLPFVGKLAL
jgi:hypothetical protein